MRTLTFVVVLLLVGIVSVGFYRGWFQVLTDNTDQRPSATVTVDKGTIHADEQKVKEKMEDFGQEAKEKIGDRAGKTKEAVGANHAEGNN
jgi:hypothetical protein